MCPPSPPLATALLSIDLNRKNNNGNTPFHSACHNGQPDVVKIFMENVVALRINLNRMCTGGWTAFNSASCRGYLDVVKLIMENAAAMKIFDQIWLTILHAEW